MKVNTLPKGLAAEQGRYWFPVPVSLTARFKFVEHGSTTSAGARKRQLRQQLGHENIFGEDFHRQP